MPRLIPLLALVLTLPLRAADQDPAPPAPQPGDLRVMSFNVRYGTAKDGPDHWDLRKDFLAATIKRIDPDLLGTQETLALQAEYLRAQLPGHTFVGVGRDDGKEKGEMAALFFRTDRFEKLDAGTYWMSPTPDVVGSKGWDAALPRVTTWVKLKDKAAAGRVLYFFNTHFDHRGTRARVEAAKMLRQRIEALGDGAVAVVTGDFNVGEGSEPYRALVTDPKAPAADQKVRITDAFREAHPESTDADGTFNGFKGKRTGDRIDWVLHTPALSTVAAGTDHAAREGRYPSDHFPIWATLR